MSRYDYKELRARAVETEAEEDLAALGEWLERYGRCYWNGECYDIDDGLRLFPIYGEATEDGDYELSGWEIR